MESVLLIVSDLLRLISSRCSCGIDSHHSFGLVLFLAALTFAIIMLRSFGRILAQTAVPAIEILLQRAASRSGLRFAWALVAFPPRMSFRSFEVRLLQNLRDIFFWRSGVLARAKFRSICSLCSLVGIQPELPSPPFVQLYRGPFGCLPSVDIRVRSVSKACHWVNPSRILTRGTSFSLSIVLLIMARIWKFVVLFFSDQSIRLALPFPMYRGTAQTSNIT